MTVLGFAVTVALSTGLVGTAAAAPPAPANAAALSANPAAWSRYRLFPGTDAGLDDCQKLGRIVQRVNGWGWACDGYIDETGRYWWALYVDN